MTLRTIACKLLLLPINLENWIVLSIGIAWALAWFTGELVELGSSDPWNVFLLAFLSLFRRMTITFLIFGSLAWSLRWFRSRVLVSPLGAKGENHQIWFFLVIIILVVHGALVVVFADPLPRLFQDNIQLLQKWGVWEGIWQREGQFSGIYLVPVLGILMAPGMAVMTAFSFFAGAIAVLGYLLLGLENTSRVLLRSIFLQIAFLLGLFFILDFFELGIRIVSGGFTGPDALELKAQVLPWLTGQVDHFALIAWHFTWLLPGFLICAAIVFRKAQQRSFQDKEIPLHISEEVPMHMPERKPIHIHEERPVAESPGIEFSRTYVETDARFQHKTYLIKYKFFSNPFHKDFDVYDSDNKVIFIARMSGFSLWKRVITVYAAGKERTETLSITGTRIIRFPNILEMRFCPANKKVGTFKNSPAGWVILDEYGRQIATLNQEEDPMGTMKRQIIMGSESVCEYRFETIIRPVIMIDFPEESKTIFDRKLGIGLALVLGFQSVAFNYTYYNN